MSQNNFSSEKIGARKNFKKQIGEIKKITRKILTERNLSNERNKKCTSKKNSANNFLKKFCMQRKINWILDLGRRSARRFNSSAWQV